MKSIKPGRGTSKMGAVGAIFVSVMGVVWTISAAKSGAPITFPIFGAFFVLMGIGIAIFHLKNATSKNRYSLYDITDDNEEIDPLSARFMENKHSNLDRKPTQDAENNFCPYCGMASNEKFVYCMKCGEKLP